MQNVSTGVPVAPSRLAPFQKLKRPAARGVSLVMAGALGVAGMVALGTGVASAAVPTAPNNVVVFPERDFVTIEGYQDRVGQTATVSVTRGTTVMGSAVGTVAEGDVAFEINHPGGYCWGAGTGLNVTPDIQKGDKVSIKFADGTSDDTTVGTGAATKHAVVSAGNTVTVTGTYGDDVNTGQAEVRIVNPDLTAVVGKRDVRAVPGPMTPAPKGGYSSSLEMTGGAFTATYVFDTAAGANAAAAPQVERFMSWQVEDADANRQGLTISEFGELGGPGMGGCPAGPGDVAPPKASYTATRSADKTKLAVKWTAAEPIPGAAAITGYNVEAIKADNTLLGARTAATATGVTLNVDAAVADYKVEVRTMTDAKLGEPFTAAPATPGTGTPPADQTIPQLSATPAAGDSAATAVEATSVSLASESAADVYYTTDGSPALTGDLPSDTATLYKAPIAITKATEIHAAAIDRAGNISTQVVGFYKAPAASQPGALTAPVVAQPAGTDLGKTSIKLNWAKVDNATAYQVTVSTDAGVALPAAQQPAETANLTQTVAGLAGSTAYRFSVVAINSGGKSAASNVVRASTLENLSIGTARWKAGDFRVTGTSSATNGTITVHRANADGTAGAQIGTLQAALTAAVAPATGSTYDWRLRAGVPTTNPGRIVVKSNTGAVSAVFTATNG